MRPLSFSLSLLSLSSLTLMGALSAVSYAQTPEPHAQPQAQAQQPQPQAQEKTLKERVSRLLREAPLIDGHNDVAWQLRKRAQNQLSALDLAQSTQDKAMHTDLQRLKEGGLGAQFWSVYVPASLAPSEAVQATMEQIDVVKRMVARYPEQLELAMSADEVEAIHKRGKLASLIGMEGGSSMGHSLGVLRQLYALGARYMTLTHSKTLPWADSATDEPQHDGLSAFGEEVVREMNRLGMIIDLSHVAPSTMRDTLKVSEAPVLFMHSGARAVCDHPRNVPDDVLEQLKERDGVVMVVFLPSYLKCGAKGASLDHAEVTISDVVAHIDHIKRVAGVEHIGIGGDYDGMNHAPHGLEDVSTYPNLLAALLERGYSEAEVKLIMGGNTLRVMRKVEAAAARLKSSAPSETPPLHWVE